LERDPNAQREQIEAVIFDMDGVLIDSEPLWQAAEIEVFDRYGIALDSAQCRQTTGLRIDEVVAYWRRRRPWKGASEATVAAEIRVAVCALIRAQGRALPGALAAPKAVRALGLRCALASSSPPQVIDAVLDALDLRADFEVVQSAETQPLGKPHPAVYLATAAALGVPAHRCLAVEDSVNGMVSAYAARMTTVVIPEPPFRSDPRYALADFQLDSLTELPALVRRLSAKPAHHDGRVVD
jgi:HAD superfamily hydrolase (TIGR01509 family)